MFVWLRNRYSVNAMFYRYETDGLIERLVKPNYRSAPYLVGKNHDDVCPIPYHFQVNPCRTQIGKPPDGQSEQRRLVNLTEGRASWAITVPLLLSHSGSASLPVYNRAATASSWRCMQRDAEPLRLEARDGRVYWPCTCRRANTRSCAWAGRVA